MAVTLRLLREPIRDVPSGRMHRPRDLSPPYCHRLLLQIRRDIDKNRWGLGGLKLLLLLTVSVVGVIWALDSPTTSKGEEMRPRCQEKVLRARKVAMEAALGPRCKTNGAGPRELQRAIRVHRFCFPICRSGQEKRRFGTQGDHPARAGECRRATARRPCGKKVDREPCPKPREQNRPTPFAFAANETTQSDLCSVVLSPMTKNSSLS